jgi:hypothetical protein
MPSGYPALTPAYGLGTRGRFSSSLLLNNHRSKNGSQGRVYAYMKRIGKEHEYKQQIINAINHAHFPKLNPWNLI